MENMPTKTDLDDKQEQCPVSAQDVEQIIAYVARHQIKESTMLAKLYALAAWLEKEGKR